MPMAVHIYHFIANKSASIADAQYVERQFLCPVILNVGITNQLNSCLYLATMDTSIPTILYPCPVGARYNIFSGVT